MSRKNLKKMRKSLCFVCVRGEDEMLQVRDDPIIRAMESGGYFPVYPIKEEGRSSQSRLCLDSSLWEGKPKGRRDVGNAPCGRREA